MRKKLADRGLKAADVYLQTAPDFISLAPNHPDAKPRRKARDLFECTLDYAAACGAKHVSALPGVQFAEEPLADSLGRAADDLAWRCGQAASRKLFFSVEAHVGSIVPRPKQALRLLERVPGLTLTLDYTHFTRVGIADAEIEPLIKHASHFHARARKGRLQTSFKENVIDYRRVAQVMKATGYRGYLGIEYVWIDWEHCNEVDNLSETILWRDFFHSLSGDASCTTHTGAGCSADSVGRRRSAFAGRQTASGRRAAERSPLRLPGEPVGYRRPAARFELEADDRRCGPSRSQAIGLSGVGRQSAGDARRRSRGSLELRARRIAAVDPRAL